MSVEEGSIEAFNLQVMEIKNTEASPVVSEASNRTTEHIEVEISNQTQSTQINHTVRDWWSIEDVLALGASEQQYLLKDLLPQTGLAALVGKPDIGKSQLARQLAIEVASNAEIFLGIPLASKHGRVLYVLTEDPPNAIGFPLERQLTGLNKGNNTKLYFIELGNLSRKELVKKISERLTTDPVDLIIVDSFGDIFEGEDLNNNAAIRKLLKPFYALAREHECLILFLHHVTKASSNKSPRLENVLGGSAFGQKMRSILYLDDSPNGIRQLSVVKGNYTPREIKEKPLKLEFSEETFLFRRLEEPNIGTVQEEQAEFVSQLDKHRLELENLATEIFQGQRIKSKEFVSRYCSHTNKSRSEAFRDRKLMLDFAIIEKSSGQYVQVIK